MILEMQEFGYILSEIGDRQALYSENDLWPQEGDRTRNILMTGETL